MLKIEDVKIGDELLCVDFNGLVANKYFLPVMGNLHINPSVIVKDIRIDGGIINVTDSRGINTGIFSEQLIFFKKKEQSQYTFDDLIDVAVQAFKDGLLEDLKLNKYKPKSITIYDINDYELEINIEDNSNYNKFYNHIQSLYKEIFVIECDNDVNKIKNGESVLILKNGKAFKFSELMDITPSLLPDIVFGATVEQSK